MCIQAASVVLGRRRIPPLGGTSCLVFIVVIDRGNRSDPDTPIENSRPDVDHVYQVRGLDLANMTFIEGKTGWIVIDTLTSEETAKAGYQLVSEHLGKSPSSR
jgi:hypothetical protein